MKPDLLILAAGAGSRYGGLKQLAPIGPGGETLLEYSVYDAVEAGFGRVVLVVRSDHESEFRARFDNGMGRRVPLRYVHQTLDDLPQGHTPPDARNRPWGTGHAVLAAEGELEGRFTVLNADDYYGTRPFAELVRFFDSSRAQEVPLLAVVAYEVARTLTDAGPVSRAVCQTDGKGLLRDIVEIHQVWRDEDRILGLNASGEEIALATDELVSMNMWALDRAVFPELRRRFGHFLERSGGDVDREFLLPDVIGALCHEGRVEIRVLSGARQWFGMTYPEDRDRVAGLIADLVSRGRYPRELWA